MPQMAPMNWMTLYTFFIFLYMIMNYFNYYIFLKYSKNNISLKYTNLNWKW